MHTTVILIKTIGYNVTTSRLLIFCFGVLNLNCKLRIGARSAAQTLYLVIRNAYWQEFVGKFV